MGQGPEMLFDTPLGRQLAASLERGATVCASTQRLARLLSEAWDARQHAGGRRAWRTPDVLPFVSWQRRLASELGIRRAASGRSLPLILGEQQELLTWELAAAESGALDGLLQQQQLAASLMEARALASDWDIPLDDNDGLSPDAGIFVTVRQKVEARWSAIGAAPISAVGWRAVEAIRELPDLPSEILFVGFDLPANAVFRRTVAALRERGIRVELLRADHAPAEVTFLRYPSFEDELREAALWCRTLLERGERSIGVVIPQLDSVRELTQRVFAGVLQPSVLVDADGERHELFELSLGPRAVDEPLIHSALLLLEVLRSSLPVEHWSRILLAPFLHGAVTGRAGRALVDAALRRRGMREATTADVLHVADRLAWVEHDALMAALRALPASAGRHGASSWAETFTETLAAFGWPGDSGLTSRQFQARSRFRELLDEFATLDGVAGRLSCGDALARLRLLASSRIFQVRSVGAPVQVMGVRETAGLRFAHLRVLGMNDDLWPPVPRPTVFIPLRLQRQAGVPEASPELFLEQLRMQTSLLLRLAPTVVVSCAAAEGERELLPSPLLGERKPADTSPAGGDVVTVLGGNARSDIESVADDMAPPVADGEQVRGGTRVLTLQSDCPFRAFAELRLHAARPEGVEHGVRAIDRGTLAHAALAAFWSRIGDHAALLALDEAETRRAVQECVDAALRGDRAIRDRRIDGHLVDAERDCLVLLLLEWLEIERQRTPFVAELREQEVEVSLAGLPLRLFADRVDRLTDGTPMLLDYKTGKKSMYDWMGDRPAEPQMPLYVHAMGEAVRALGFAILRRGECGITGLGDDAIDTPEVTPASVWLAKHAPEIADWDSLRRHWSTVLLRLAEEFLAGTAVVDPRDADSCRWCELGALCRVRSSREEDGTEGGDAVE